MFTDDDFPEVALGHGVYCRMSAAPICTCRDQLMAIEIAKRLNRDNQVYPETSNSIRATGTIGVGQG